ncbi:MSF membrane transporter [Metarhizium album ARSEF 1941]|uniref:MSF membrane transporter n=1 Tax=Metarhizium album (strain ARSEF 1941) TaxID=1081103 RepID=A0A0B2WPS2_METAS|nr:MSF membrane transporter [Metarhizium album ARSEF 1941]KHN95482.1 MSF membrane transporter [Metarhizium album ARSEF 1941]
MSDPVKDKPEWSPAADEAAPTAANNDVGSWANASGRDSDDADCETKPNDLYSPLPTLRETHSDMYASSRRRRAESVSTATGSLAPTAARVDTVLSRIRSRPVPQFTHPLAHVRTTEASLVNFDGPDDPYHPLNWVAHKKASTTLLYGLVTMTATWTSSSYSAGTSQIAREFHVGTQVATLGTVLYLFGFGLGPMLWAPLSEVYGRRVAVMVPMVISTCFTIGSATAKDLQTLMLTRFFDAFFASAPVTNTGGVLGDMYSPDERGIAMAGYAMAVTGGPALSPIISAALVEQPSLGWRWTLYLSTMLQAVVLAMAIIFIDESYPPSLLVCKAQRLRFSTGNWALHAQFEEWDISVRELATKFLLRPVQLLCTPICFLMALYASFCYGILYMQLGAIPIIFGELRGWRPFVASLPFLAVFMGAALGCVLNIYNQTVYNRAYHAAGDRAVPEKRLPPMMLGGVVFSAGQFLLGWTADPGVHWAAPCLGLFMLGTGFFTIFQAAVNYLVDTFQAHGASAIAANTFLRSCFAGVFPLVVGPLYHNIGVGPGSSITGGIAALLIPVPFVFYKHGRQARAKSQWSKDSVC